MDRKRKERSFSLSSASSVSSSSSLPSFSDSQLEWLNDDKFGTSAAEYPGGFNCYFARCDDCVDCQFYGYGGRISRLTLCTETLPPLKIFKKLAQLNSITEIEICNCDERSGHQYYHVSPQQAVEFVCSNIRSLRFFIINCRIIEWPVQVLALKNLESLVLNCEDLDHVPTLLEAYRELGVLGPGPRSLDLEKCSTKIMTDLFRFFPNIQDLSLYTIDDVVSTEIGQLRNVKSLYIRRVYAETIFPSEMQNLKNLESLTIIAAFELAELPFPIHNLPNLKTLCIENSSLGFDFEKFFSSNASGGNGNKNAMPLESLELKENDLGNRANVLQELWPFVAKCSKLQNLDLVCNNCIHHLDRIAAGLLQIPSSNLRTLKLTGSFAPIVGSNHVDANEVRYHPENGNYLLRILEHHRQLYEIDIDTSDLPEHSQIQTLLDLNFSGIRLLDIVEAEERRSMWPYFLEHFLNRNHRLSEEQRLAFVYHTLRYGRVLADHRSG